MNEDQKKEWEEWLASRPAIIQQMAEKYPPGVYRIKEGAPYGVSCPGTLVGIFAYLEDGHIRVVVTAENKRPEAIAHEKRLGEKFGRTPEEMEAIHRSNILTEVDPIWLEAVPDNEIPISNEKESTPTRAPQEGQSGS